MRPRVTSLQLLERIGGKATPEQAHAIQRLEQAGLKFAVHFGVENAVEIARELDEAIRDGKSFRWMRMWGISE